MPRTADNGVHLSPVPAKNTLFTIIFFSVLAAALFYWVFFQPAAPQVSETAATANTQPAEKD